MANSENYNNKNKKNKTVSKDFGILALQEPQTKIDIVRLLMHEENL